jgi:hypothetical protein
MNIKEWSEKHGKNFILEIFDISYKIKVRRKATGKVIINSDKNMKKLDIDKLNIDFVELAYMSTKNKDYNLN